LQDSGLGGQRFLYLGSLLNVGSSAISYGAVVNHTNFSMIPFWRCNFRMFFYSAVVNRIVVADSFILETTWLIV